MVSVERGGGFASRERGRAVIARKQKNESGRRMDV